MTPPIFLLGITEKSGTNHLQELLGQHPDCCTPETIHEDYLLFGSDRLVEYVETVFSKWDPKWGHGLGDPEKTDLLKHIGQGLLGFLESRNSGTRPRLLTKTPNVTNLHLFFELFPDSRLIILVRDGRAVVESLVKSFNCSYEDAIRKWTDAARVIADFVEKHPQPQDRYRLVRYEDIYSNTQQVLAELLDFLELPEDRYPFEKIEDMPVRGSSVFRGDTSELHWDPVKKTEAFNPPQRFQHWSDDLHRQFNQQGAELLKFFGYHPKASSAYAFSFQMTLDAQGQLAQPAPSRPTLYCKTPGSLSLLDDNSFLFVDHANGNMTVLGRDSALILNDICQFDTLDNHIDNCPFLEQLGRDAVAKHLDEQLNAGLLISDRVFLGTLTGGDAANSFDVSQRIPIIIRTCDRPDHIKQILDSLSKRESPEKEPVFIFEDSRDANALQANRRTVEKYQATAKLDLELFDLPAQEQFIARLCDNFPQHGQTIRWLLSPRNADLFTGGRLHNFMLLRFAGQRIVNYDDDYLLDAAKELENRSQDAVSIGQGITWDMIGYASSEELFEEGILHDLDPTRQHARIIGKTLSSLLKSKTGGDAELVSINGLSHEYISQFTPSSRILTTGNGQYGQPIEPNAIWLYTSPHHFQPRPWENPTSYMALREGEYYWKSSRDVRVTKYTLGTPTGIDNALLPPPTIPVGRSEDTLWGIMLQTIHPNSVHVELPWAIAHFREKRNWQNPTIHDPAPPNLPFFMWSFAQQHTAVLKTICNPAERMITLGETFLGWASKTDREVKADIMEIWSSWLSRRILLLNRQLMNPATNNQQYLEDVRNILDASKTQLADLQSFPSLDEIPPVRQEQQRIHWVREQFEAYGRALRVWPELWEYCREQNTETSPTQHT